MPYSPGKLHASLHCFSFRFTDELAAPQVTLLRVLVFSRRDAPNVTPLRRVDPTRSDPTYTGKSRLCSFEFSHH